MSDPRSKLDVTHDLASLIRTCVLLAAQGWRDHDDADALRDDPTFRLAVSSAAGLTPLEGSGIASQPTLSRFTTIMAEPANLKVLREAVLEMAGRGIRAERQGNRADLSAGAAGETAKAAGSGTGCRAGGGRRARADRGKVGGEPLNLRVRCGCFPSTPSPTGFFSVA